MASKVTNDDILKMNEIYYKVHTYAETARQTGFSASTVKKYIIKGWEPIAVENVPKFDLSTVPEPDKAAEQFKGIENYGDLCTYSEEEEKEIHELWKEIAV